MNETRRQLRLARLARRHAARALRVVFGATALASLPHAAYATGSANADPRDPRSANADPRDSRATIGSAAPAPSQEPIALPRIDEGSGAAIDAPVVGAVPPPPKLTYLQYGVAFAAEFATHGAFCEDTQLNCILGSGGGIVGRVGWRSAGDWYVGGAYELSKQDPTKLLRLAILQQLRAEARHYWLHGLDTQPVVTVGAGVAGYGNEWSVATWGPCGFIGAGLESQFMSGPVLGVTVGYRPLFLQKFDDATGASHGPGVAHLFAIELALEAREPL